MNKLETLFKALGDVTRLRILKLLEVRPVCNCEVQEIFKLAPSTISKHLGLLKNAGLIEGERKGKWIIYRLVEQAEPPYGPPLLALLRSWLNEQQQTQDDAQQLKRLQNRFACASDTNAENDSLP